MKNERIKQIKTSLNGLGTKTGELYTNQEIVDSLKELQSALAKGVFEKTHAENLRDRDIVVHFEALAKEYGLDSTETFIRFKSNMSELGYTIGSLIKGMSGERHAQRALKLLSFDKGVKILYNVQLEDGDVEAEYDAIVIAPYGLFVVEVKNWNSSVVITSDGLLERNDDSGIVYDLIGRMSIKQALLREYIGEDFPENYQNILVFANEKVKVEDQYRKMPVVCGGGVSYKIREYSSCSKPLTDKQISGIEQAIMAYHKVQKSTSPVNCEEIIEDYAVLMASIEAASADCADDIVGTAPNEAPEMSQEQTEHHKEKLLEQINWKKVGGYAAVSIVPVVVPVIAYGLLQLRKH